MPARRWCQIQRETRSEELEHEKSTTRRGFLEASMLTAAVIVGGSPLPGRTQENKTASPAAQPPHRSITVGSALPADHALAGDGRHAHSHPP